MRATQSRAKLRDMLGAEIVAEEHNSAPRQFVEDFDKVCTHYGLTKEETEEAKQAARRDLDNAIICFSSLAREIE